MNRADRPTAGVEHALDAAWREHWGRLLAVLIGRFRRVELAEEALAEAYARAAERWRVDGVPDNPPAWLLTTARRRALDLLRAEAVAGRRFPLVAVDPVNQDDHEPGDDDQVADDRLRLILLCCHPALPQSAQIALALRLVLGVDTEEIARLFLVSHPTMSARLTRAKRKIARAGLPLRLPGPDRLPERIDAAVRAAYLGFTAGYAPGSGTDLLRVDLAGETIRLTRVLAVLAPGPPVITALLALMVLQHARRDARVHDGRLVVLAEQDRTRWHRTEIAEGRSLLGSVPDSTGLTEELRLQGLIAAEHAIAVRAEDTDWTSIAGLYARLEELTGSPVVRLNRAVAVAEARGPRAGLALLDGLAELLPHSHRLPAVEADLLHRAGDVPAARQAYELAIARAGNEVERRHLRDRLAVLDLNPSGR